MQAQTNVSLTKPKGERAICIPGKPVAAPWEFPVFIGDTLKLLHIGHLADVVHHGPEESVSKEMVCRPSLFRDQITCWGLVRTLEASSSTWTIDTTKPSGETTEAGSTNSNEFTRFLRL